MPQKQFEVGHLPKLKCIAKKVHGSSSCKSIYSINTYTVNDIYSICSFCSSRDPPKRRQGAEAGSGADRAVDLGCPMSNELKVGSLLSQDITV